MRLHLVIPSPIRWAEAEAAATSVPHCCRFRMSAQRSLSEAKRTCRRRDGNDVHDPKRSSCDLMTLMYGLVGSAERPLASTLRAPHGIARYCSDFRFAVWLDAFLQTGPGGVVTTTIKPRAASSRPPPSRCR